jgi:ketosteroid isomerase-like protein
MRPLRAKIEGRVKTRAQRIIADGDFVAVEARGDNVTKAGEPYCNTYCFVFRFQAGELKEVTEYQDTELAARVLGDPGE